MQRARRKKGHWPGDERHPEDRMSGTLAGLKQATALYMPPCNDASAAEVADYEHGGDTDPPPGGCVPENYDAPEE